MALKDILKKDGHFIKIDFGALRRLFRDAKIKIKFFSDNKIEVHHHYDSSQTLHINTAKIKEDKEQEEQLKEMLHSAIDAEYTVLDSKSEKTVIDYKEEEKTEDYSKVIDFFKDKLPPRDLEIIKAALYVRRCFKRGESVDKLKMDIIHIHGKRGNNIVNLCTAGYFESYLVPLYDILIEDKETKTEAIDDFFSVFDTMAEELPFSVFVCYKMGREEVKNQIIKKLESNVKYSIKFLNIHGIGTHNIKTIRDTISEIEKSRKFKKTINEKNKIISVRLELER